MATHTDTNNMCAMKQILILLFLLLSINAYSQEDADSTGTRLLSDITYKAELSATAGSGDHAPLWLHSNRFGLPSAKPNSGYLRGGLFRDASADSLHRWRYGYGLDVAVAAGHTSHLIIQQAYFDVNWLHGRLSVGAKERPMELKDNRFSSGGQTLGINSRPIPQVRLELPEYWTVPLTRGWVQIKGHIGYGMMTDKNWQHDFTGGTKQYTDNALFHSKAGYLRIKHEDYDYPLSLELGLEMACVFGGNTYNHPNYPEIENGKGLKSFLNAFIPGGGDSYEKGSVYENTEGNHLGSYLIRVNYEKKKWKSSLYFEKFFEDQSGMFGVDYDGYGSGSAWNSHSERKYLLYDFKDMLLAWDLELKEKRWVRNLLLEYLYTKYQSGPIYHDHNPGNSDHIGGIDEYYNHYIYPGWQHWGEAIGNPLYYSPIYNDDGMLRFKNNRFMAFHLGVGGQPTKEIAYRLLASWEEGLGTYRQPYTKKKHQTSFLLEGTYTPQRPSLRGWSASLGLGLDSGDIIGDNFGCNLTIRKQGVLTSGHKR